MFYRKVNSLAKAKKKLAESRLKLAEANFRLAKATAELSKAEEMRACIKAIGLDEYSAKKSDPLGSFHELAERVESLFEMVMEFHSSYMDGTRGINDRVTALEKLAGNGHGYISASTYYTIHNSIRVLLNEVEDLGILEKFPHFRNAVEEVRSVSGIPARNTVAATSFESLRGEGAGAPRRVVLAEVPPYPEAQVCRLVGEVYLNYMDGYRAGWADARAEVEHQQQGGQADG